MRVFKGFAGRGRVSLVVALCGLLVGASGCGHVIAAVAEISEEQERQEAEERRRLAAEQAEAARLARAEAARVEREREEARRREEQEAQRRAEVEEARRVAEAKRQAEEAERQAEEERVRAIEARAAELGFTDWRPACTNFRAMHLGICAGAHETSYDVERCRADRKERVDKKDHFYVPSVPRTVSYDAKRKRFKVEVMGIFDADIDVEDCWDGGCDNVVVATRSMRLTGGRAEDATWLRRFAARLDAAMKPIATIYVKESELSDPAGFEAAVRVEALVNVVDREAQSVGEWLSVRSLRVKVVGLRAFVPGLDWGKQLRRPPADVHCQPDPTY